MKDYGADGTVDSSLERSWSYDLGDPASGLAVLVYEIERDLVWNTIPAFSIYEWDDEARLLATRRGYGEMASTPASWEWIYERDADGRPLRMDESYEGAPYTVYEWDYNGDTHVFEIMTPDGFVYHEETTTQTGETTFRTEENQDARGPVESVVQLEGAESSEVDWWGHYTPAASTMVKRYDFENDDHFDQITTWTFNDADQMTSSHLVMEESGHDESTWWGHNTDGRPIFDYHLIDPGYVDGLEETRIQWWWTCPGDHNPPNPTFHPSKELTGSDAFRSAR